MSVPMKPFSPKKVRKFEVTVYYSTSRADTFKVLATNSEDAGAIAEKMFLDSRSDIVGIDIIKHEMRELTA